MAAGNPPMGLSKSEEYAYPDCGNLESEKFDAMALFRMDHGLVGPVSG